MEEDISPWRQTQHDDAHHPQPHPHQSSIGLHKNKAIRSSMPYLQFDLTASAFLDPRKIIIGQSLGVPEFARSRSLGVGLPKLPSRYEGAPEKRGSFRSGHLQPIQKITKQPQLRVRKDSISQASTGMLRTKLESLLKQQESSSSSSPIRFCRNLSEVQAKGNPIIRQKNIVFLYTPPSSQKQVAQSPKKRNSGHILDKLLSDWK